MIFVYFIKLVQIKDEFERELVYILNYGIEKDLFAHLLFVLHFECCGAANRADSDALYGKDFKRVTHDSAVGIEQRLRA